ncbi:MAG: hypothetical protein Ct9H300mP20_16840 [Gammaproteobacteria bacterium]|nr:MAG: hypothetical protein Ct9H300mP20_16840 [Gammaproteobacteria bacterium]
MCTRLREGAPKKSKTALVGIEDFFFIIKFLKHIDPAWEENECL